MGRRACNVALVFLAAAGVSAQEVGPGAEEMAVPQYAVLELSAGANLISAPLDAGTALARDAFLGLPADWPLFFGWDSDTQDFVPSNEAPLVVSGGYWVFTPVPTTVMVSGQPFDFFTHVNLRLEPGFHLLGVPFTEGIDWRSLRLHGSGNPVGLETAFDLGWLDSTIVSMRGSQWVYHEPGQPFQPGWAYWLRTKEPFAIRAERRDEPLPEQLEGQTGPDGGGARGGGEKAVGWLSAIAEAMVSVLEGGDAIAEEKWGEATFKFLGAGFGLIEHGLSGNKDQAADQLAEIDNKLDILVAETDAIASQLATVVAKIDGLQAHLDSEAKLGQPMRNAEAWLEDYYLSHTKPVQSRAWARWVLAGCDPSHDLECTKQVSTATYDAFTTAYLRHPGSTTTSTDDFPLWWAYSVLGGHEGVPPYQLGGSTADGHVTLLWKGLVDDAGTPQNGLMNYMQFVYSKSPCATDVSSKFCDLYAQVYLPVEAYFSKVMADQTQLVEAVAEAYGVLAQKDPQAHGHDVATYMKGVTTQVNQEAESFLKVAEQIALLRAADGLHNWGSFVASDAGQLLARADFVVARLAGAYHLSSPPPSYHNPPWPSQGVVGRVFYADGETPAAGPRSVCAAADTSCKKTVASLSEVGETPRSVAGDWPYFLWKKQNDVAVAVPTDRWQVRRLVPETGLLPGSYNVTSSDATRGVATLVVADYDDAYDNPPQGSGEVIRFASFNGLEGPLGPFALNGDRATWKASDLKPDNSHGYGYTPSVSLISYGVSYEPDSTSRHDKGAFENQMKLEVPAHPFSGTYKSVRLHWETTLVIDVDSKVTNWGGCDDVYYRNLEVDLQLLDAKGKPVRDSATLKKRPCGDSFNACSYSNADHSIHSDPLQLGTTTVYTLKVSFSDEVYPSSWINYPSRCGRDRSAVGGSKLSWWLAYPMLTLVK